MWRVTSTGGMAMNAGTGFMNLLIGIIIIAIIGYFVFYYYQHKQKKDISELQNQREDLMAVPVADTLYTLKNMNLTGQTRRTYESWQATWQTITRFSLPEIEAAIISAQQANERYNLVKATKSIDFAKQQLKEAKRNIDKVYKALQRLLDSEEQNRKKGEDIQNDYNELRKNLLSQSFTYGDALDSLEKRLSYLELDFTKFHTLSNEGDHMEAKDVLSQIETEMTELNDVIKQIPEFYKEIKETYEPQVEDLKNGYQRLLSEKYLFNDIDVEADIKAIEDLIVSAENSIKGIKLGDARKELDKVKREIDQTYDEMEAEITAKQYVDSHIQTVHLQLEKALKNNRYGALEVDRMGQNYILHNNEEVKIAEFQSQLEEEQDKLNHYDEQLADNAVAFSLAKDYLELLLKRLTDIMHQQSDMMKQLATLRQQEEAIKTNLDEYEIELRNMKRHIEKANIPGLPKSYLDLFFQTSDMIEALNSELNRVRIDLPVLNAKDEAIAKQIERLEDLTDSIVDDAHLTEAMIQYANRYRLDNETIALAIQQSLAIFDREYDYSRSLEIIEKALAKIDAEAPQNVRQSYQRDKANRVL